MVIKRYLTKWFTELCFQPHKMAFISGPRQCGKTTFSKALLHTRGVGHYYNWDEKTFRQLWTKNPSAAVQSVMSAISPSFDGVPLIIFDEIHKTKLWKRDIKGIYDTLASPVDILVTGSAKLDVYRRGSDSLMGRYHHFRLHPFSVAELLNHGTAVLSDRLLSEVLNSDLKTNREAQEQCDRLWQFGPFPEPLFSGTSRALNLWQRERVERLVREDLRDLSRIQELDKIQMLVSILPERVASALSINSLREDLEVAHATMKSWINHLKYVYYLFEIKPYSTKIPRGLKKEGKLYLWDWSEVEQEGARFENMIASHLLKYAQFLTDIGDARVDLCYLKNKQKYEIDFLLLKNRQPWIPIEVKLSDEVPSKHWSFYFQHLPCKTGFQIIKRPGFKKCVMVPGGEVWVLSMDNFLPFLV